MINRTIKYRFWDFKEMITWDKINKEHCFYYLANFNNERSYIVAMQYTGLKDKNGKEIYEGDIVKYKNYNGFSVIRYEKGSFFFYGISVIHFLFNVKEKDVEIIGNIYENPEFTQSSE